MKNLKYLILFAIAIMFFSCGEDDPCEAIVCQNLGICVDGKCDCPDGFEGDLCQEKKLLLKNVFKNGVIDEHYEYNEDRTIAKKVDYLFGEPQVEFLYKYTSDSIIIQGLNIASGSTFSNNYYKISEDQLKFEAFFVGGEASNYYTIYNQFDQDCGYSNYGVYNLDDELVTENIIDFVDEKCSYFQTRTNKVEDIQILTVDIKNDDKNYYNESTIIKYLQRPNQGNPVSRIIKDEDDQILGNSSFISNYTYNDDLYPSEEVRTYSNGNERIFTYEYY